MKPPEHPLDKADQGPGDQPDHMGKVAPALEMQGLSLTLGDGPGRVDALIDINLAVYPGELVAITGRSGSGKSSLLNVAGGLVRPSAGKVIVDDVELGSLDAAALAVARRRRVGYVFQDLNLLATLTARENVSLPLELDGMAVKEARRLAAQALRDVDVAELADRFPDEISGGHRQRVAIARGLVGGRTLLLADEPTGALDELTAEAIMGILRAKCESGSATLVVTHDPSLAAWADRVIRLRDGRIDSESKRSSTPTQALLSGLGLPFSSAPESDDQTRAKPTPSNSSAKVTGDR